MATTGDNNQLLPGNNIAANSSTSSSISGTTTNTSNTSTTPTSGTTTSESEQIPGKPIDGGVEGCPPPHPGKHEGKPSTTWTPPFVGNSGNQTQVGN